jgi:UDP-N-acetylmuramoylalanine--D-glutamate ligase
MNRRIAILGAGREGLAAAQYLRAIAPGIELVIISESAPDDDSMGQIHELGKLLIRPFSKAHLEQYEVLIRSPGISIYRPELKAARSAGVEITTPSNLWFAAHPDANTICVTGTKGKSTTSAMIAHALRGCGLQVRLAGNIGLPLLSCEDAGVDWWVIELSSYQLADLEATPTVGVLLNLSVEHLDWHGNVAAYRRDKLRLANLCKNGILILNAADPVLVDELSEVQTAYWFNSDLAIHVSGSQVSNGPQPLPVSLAQGLPGAHNLSNAAAALTAVNFAGCDLVRAAHALSTFRGLPHRLQLVGERSGIRFYNDSISSTPMATQAALRTFAGENITIIVGGLDRGLDWTPYMETFRQFAPGAVIAIPDSGARILDTMRAEGIKAERGLHLASGLEEAVEMASRLTAENGLVLLSPGAPSFPRFRDYRDRGRQFAQFSGFELDEWDVF